MKQIFLFSAIFFFRTAMFGQWAEIAQTIPASFLNSAVAYDGKVYNTGGPKTQFVTIASYNDKLSIIDLATGTITTAPGNLSVGRAGMMAVAYDGKIYFAGGHKWTANSSVTTFNNIDIYDIASNTWTLKHLSSARTAGGAAVVNGKILFAGGTIFINGISEPSDVIDVYDPVLEQFTIEHLPLARSEVGVAVHDNKVYFCGGFTDWETPSCVSRVDVYDAIGGGWTNYALSEARTNASVVAVDKYIVAAGGYTNTAGSSSTVDIFNTETGVWSAKTLTAPRCCIAAAVIGKKAYFTGGGHYIFLSGYLDASSNRVDIFDATTESIVLGPYLNKDRVTHSCAAWGNKIAVAGGWRAGQMQTIGSVEILTDLTSDVQAPALVNLAVYPNPTFDLLTVSLREIAPLPDRLTITDVVGKIWKVQALQDADAISVETADLSPGLYFLNIERQQETVAIGRFVVIK